MKSCAPSLLEPAVSCLVDRDAEELSLSFESFRAEIPPDPQSSWDRVAAERALLLDDTAEGSVVELAALGISPTRKLDRAQRAAVIDRQREFCRLPLYGQCRVWMPRIRFCPSSAVAT